MYLTLNGLIPLFFKFNKDMTKQDFFLRFLLEKEVNARQLKTLHAPAVIGDGVFFPPLQVRNLFRGLCQENQVAKQYNLVSMGCSQNTKGHLVRFSLGTNQQ